MLNERQKKIMITIVESYTENSYAEPIGSSALSKMEGLDYSTATLRNDMALLEEMGYLEKTHTSSGRIPTEKGYRLYVDELMNLDGIVDEVNEQVNMLYEESHLPKKEATEKIIKMVIDNHDLNYGAILLEKTAYNSKIKKIDFVYLKHHRGLFLLITDQGQVLYKESQLPDAYNIKNIEKTMEFLNMKLHDVLLNDFKNATRIQINDDFFEYMSNGEAIIELCLRSIAELVDDKKTILGQFNILSHPDFMDIEFAQNYLDAIKNGTIYDIVQFESGPLPAIGNQKNFIVVRIGHENNNPVMNKCSAITAYYHSSSGTGAITIYGPLRMKYRNIIAALNGICNNMN